MWTITSIIVALLTISPVKGERASFKGCFSSSFIDQYAFYYRINQSLPLKQSFAACDYRLTKFIGLQVDKSTPTYNVVYCGNDLSEVSVKVSDSACHTCQENVSLSCGGDGVMSVYKLRDSTPFAVLATTYHGVEMLIDNTSTLLIDLDDHYIYEMYLDYIYTEDTIIFTVGPKVYRSSYDSFMMKCTDKVNVWFGTSNDVSLTVDYNQITAYYGDSQSNMEYFDQRWDHACNLIKHNLTSLHLSNISHFYFTPRLMSVDPYNRSLVYFSYDKVHIFLLDDQSIFENSIDQINVLSVHAMTTDPREQLVYAIVTLKTDYTTYLVSIDFRLSKMRLLFSGPQLEKVTVLEVFNGDAVWLQNVGKVSTIYKCSLTPRCSLQNLAIFTSERYVYDFSIYHPLKQTPGKKRLCANMSCVHGCELFSPFTARCSCPPGMDMDPVNNTCYARQTPPAPLDSFSTGLQKQEEIRNTFTATTPKPVVSKDKTSTSSENNGDDDSGPSLFESFVVISIIMLFAILVSIFVALYRMNTKVTYVLDNRFQLQELYNE